MNKLHKLRYYDMFNHRTVKYDEKRALINRMKKDIVADLQLVRNKLEELVKKKKVKKEKKETKKIDSKKQKAKDESKDLGFTKGTEKFGDCVMKMLSM